MGIGGISIWQLLIILAIVILLFGTKRLKGIGGDLGSAVKGFKKAMDSEEEQKDDKEQPQQKIAQEDASTTETTAETAKNTEKKD